VAAGVCHERSAKRFHLLVAFPKASTLEDGVWIVKKPCQKSMLFNKAHPHPLPSSEFNPNSSWSESGHESNPDIPDKADPQRQISL
jgi:hypothetical protein